MYAFAHQLQLIRLDRLLYPITFSLLSLEAIIVDEDAAVIATATVVATSAYPVNGTKTARGRKGTPSTPSSASVSTPSVPPEMRL